MLDDPAPPHLGPEEVDRLLTAAFARPAPTQQSDPDRPIFEDLRLEVRESLGHGGLGAVYRCRDRRMKREVALKVLRVQHAGNISARDGLLWEARLGSRLDHPGIVPVHEIGVDDTGRPFFTMRVVRGQTLRPILLAERTGEAGRARLLRILLQVAEAVAHAHAEGIVHSDLKPENVMVGPNGEVLVLDWGLAREQDEDDDRRASSSSSKAGTPAYMAPERAESPPPRLSPAVDVFALGVMLLEAMTGPSAGATTSSTTAELGSGAELARRLDSSHPADFAALAERSVARRPEDRPADATEFARRLGSILEDIEEGARRARLEAAAASARAEAERRARRAVLGLSAAVLITAGLAGGLWWRADRARERRRDAQVLALQSTLDESHSLAAGLDPALPSLREASALLERHARALDTQLLPPEWIERFETRREELARQVVTAEAEEAELRWRHELRAALEAGRLRGLAGVHDTGLGRTFALALEDAGMNAMATTVAELAAPYPLDAVRAELVDAFDTWAMFGLSLESEGSRSESRRLRSLAQELDPDHGRREVRAAAIAGDDEVLRRLVPTNSSAPYESATTYMLLGAALADAGDLSLAHAAWGAGCFAFPDDPWCHVLLGYDWEARGEKSALEHLWAAIALEPRNPSPWTNLASVYMQERRTDEALRAFRRVAELRPRASVALGNYWKAQYDLLLLEGALTTARRWEELHPSNPEASHAVLVTLRDLGRNEDVLKEQRRIAQRWRDEGGEKGAPLVYAESLWKTGALEDARFAYGPRDDTPTTEHARRHYLAGRVAMDQGELEEAIDLFDRALDDEAIGTRALAMRGLALARLERLVEAREALRRVQALVSDDPEWNFPTGQWLEVVEGDLRLDAVIADEVVAADPRESANAGQRALEKGDPTRAFELYRSAFEPDPEAAGVPLIDGARAALLALDEARADGGGIEDDRADLYRAMAWRWARYHFDGLSSMHSTGDLGARWIDDLRSWETSETFAPVRDPDALERLPESAREAWSTLWSEIRRFLETLDDDR